MSLVHYLRRRIKARDNVVTHTLYRVITGFKYYSIPPIPFLHQALYAVLGLLVTVWRTFLRIFITTPAFRSQLAAPVESLNLQGQIPYIAGNVEIRLGNFCRIGSRINIQGFSGSAHTPQLTVGENCDLGWGANFMVGRRIIIGNNVRLASSCFLAGYSGHSYDAQARARGAGDDPDQIGDIALEDDVWLGTGVTVLKGVTIGRGTIVGTGSIVTRDLPPFVLAVGNPARIIRQLSPEQGRETKVIADAPEKTPAL